MFKFILLISVAVYIDVGFACDGYKLKVSSIENCGGDAQVVSIDKNFTATITPNCEVVTKGCITSKGFTKAKVNYKISKDGMVIFSGKPNICEALDKKSEEQKARLQMFGFPTQCPFPEERRCVDGDKKINITKFKNMLGMALGKVAVESDIEHDTGKSCIKMKFEIYK